MHRKRKTRAKKKNQSDKSSESNEANEELAYLDTLPEVNKFLFVVFKLPSLILIDSNYSMVN